MAERTRLEDPEIGVILLTGFRPVIDPGRLKKFDYVLEKPVDPKKIFDAVRSITRSAE